MRPQPLISVADVEASSRWYQRLLGLTSAHGGPEYERLNRGDVLVLQLHRWEVEHHHGPIGDPAKPSGNGVLLWFDIDDFDDAIARVEELGAEIVMAPYHHAGASQREVWLRDRDGYTVVLSCQDEKTGSAA